MVSSPRPSHIAAVSLAAALLAGCGGRNDSITQAGKKETNRPTIAETKAIAEEGFVYGLPIVMNYAATYQFFVDKTSNQYKCGFNEIFNEARVFTYKDTAVVTPNSDTPYSFAGLDLRAEPYVVKLPAVEKTRYYSLQLIDANTYNFGYAGSRTTGSGGGDFLVAGPDWKGEAPAGIKNVYRSTTQFAIALFRTQLFSSADMENVKKVQAGYKLQALSSFLMQPAPPAAPAISFPKVDADLMKTEFFDYLDFALQFAPERPEEKEVRAKLVRIGVGPGKTFSFKDLSLAHKAEILLGMKEGEKKVEQKVETVGKNVNGWKVGAAFGDASFYKGDWLLRAAAAKAGIYGNDAVEAMYPMTKAIPDGTPLDGSKHAYTLTFAAGQYPPVDAFWSVTMYDGKTQFLIENPIDRYLINSPMLPGMKKNPDGSLTIALQKGSPGKGKEANWLPAPDGPIYLVMRLYWPKTEPPSILPPGEGTWQPPAVVQVP